MSVGKVIDVSEKVVHPFSLSKVKEERPLDPEDDGTTESLTLATSLLESRKYVIPVVRMKLGKWYLVKHNCVTIGVFSDYTDLYTTCARYAYSKILS